MAFFTTAAILAATAASAAVSINSANNQRKASKSAAEEATRKNDAAIQAVKDGQVDASSKAAAKVRNRVSGTTQTVYTSPLGLAGQADTVKKTLLGG